MRRGMGLGSGKRGYYNLVPIDSHIHSLSAKGVKSSLIVTYPYVVNKIKQMKMDDKHKLMLGLAYGVAGEDLRNLDYKSETVQNPELAKEMVKEIKFYNDFDYRKVNAALDKVSGDLMSIKVGREGSPVIYLELPYWESQKYKSKKENRRLTDAEVEDIYKRVKVAFKDAKVDEFSSGAFESETSFEEPKDAEHMRYIRLWWD
jgi:hypothetical protein